jgi:hypothetical protein
MPAFAPAALGIAVVLSALGAVVLCLLVVLYGFTPADEDAPRRAPHRLLLTRVGHTVAAACFTATAILISIVLAGPAPAPVLPAVGPPAVPDARVPELGERIAGQETRLTASEARIRELEDALRRREAEQPRRASEPPAREPARPRSTPAPARTGAPPSPDPDESTVSAIPAPAASPPAPQRPSTPASAVAPSPPGPALAPAAPPPPPVAVTAPSRSTPSPAAAPRRGLDLPGKLRDDWQEIQRGVDSAGDDFRSAVDDLRRRLLGN